MGLEIFRWPREYYISDCIYVFHNNNNYNNNSNNNKMSFYE